MATEIHSTAVVSKEARIGSHVEIGPYSVIGPDVTIGEGTQVGPQVIIDGVTTIGENNRIFGQANLGGAPQDLSYEGEPTRLEIGDRNTIREFVTINRGTVKGGGLTRTGSDCLLMACCHVAHDCEIGDGAMLANNVLLAGHVEVCGGAIINGAAAAHQFVTIGRNAYVGGLTRMVQDVPPFMVQEGHPSRVRKVNIVGLERAGHSREEIGELRQAFRRIYRSGEPRSSVLDELEGEKNGALVTELIASLRNTELGSKGRYRETLRDSFRRLGIERIYGSQEVS